MRRRAMNALWALGLGLLVVGSRCGGSNLPVSKFGDQRGGVGDQKGGEDAGADRWVQPELVLDREGDVGVELFGECGPGEGCFGDPCVETTDCQSGLCVEHMGSRVCSKYCIEDCPEGWKCQQVSVGGTDGMFACLSAFPVLCRPCWTDDDCKTLSGATAPCVKYGAQGGFCGGGCEADVACPPGFECKVGLSVGGEESMQCQPIKGICDCSDLSVMLELSTFCEVSNEWGVCKGRRSCGKEGLSECDAPIPQQEVCNGNDDDCDGETDEGVECDDGNPCTLDSCGGEAGCVNEALTGVECDDGDMCTSGDVCVDGECVGAEVSCDDGNVCTDDSCEPSSGCVHVNNEVPCDDGDPCSVGDKCKEGKCLGVPVDCECTVDEDCAALEDGNLCNGVLYCDKSKIPFQCRVDETTVIECPEPTGLDGVCLKSLCDPATGACLTVPANEGQACNDGNACTLGDICTNGKCTAAVPLVCDDGNVCTDDSCDPAVGCKFTPNEAECDDGNACTQGDHCVGGKCIGQVIIECDDGNVCTDDLCDLESGCKFVPNTAPCDDGDACTTQDHCVEGVCVAGAALICDDGNVCTDDSCDPAVGCKFTPNDGECDDGNACTQGDHCVGGKCVGQVVIECDDGNVCTDDLCDLESGCKFVPNTAPCDDGDACTTQDRCVNGTCVGGPAVVCDDGNVCTDDSCDPAVGCKFTPNGGECDDGNKCTTNDLCQGGKCVGTGSLDCDDGLVCTLDLCEPQEGCIHPPATGPCDDGNACTLSDHCHLGNCIGGQALVCDDGNVCTDDSCDPKVGCQFKPNTAPCDDGNVCTAVDVCSGGWCVGSGTVDCEDGNVCTNDFCVPGVGCVHLNNSIPCEDGNKCTVGDLCSGGECKSGPGTLKCDDNDACTVDTCDPDTGCVFTAISPCCGNAVVEEGEMCDDGNHDNGDGCSADCKSDEMCGNGILDATEECDGNLFPVKCHKGTFVCSPTCVLDTSGCSSWCGDGKYDPEFEACDGEIFPTECYEGKFECLFSCKVWEKSGCLAWCGDGVANGDEACDGFDFAQECPLSECYCSSDCTMNMSEQEGEADWKAGGMDGVNNVPEVTPDPQCKDPNNVCLDATTKSLHHVWIANSESHEVVRINVDTGKVEKEVPSLGQHPSRTAVVVKDGSVWVGNRGWNCYDNPDCSNLVHFDINGKVICKLPIKGMVRGVGIDSEGNVWASGWVHRKLHKVSGTDVDDSTMPPTCKHLAELNTAGCVYGVAGDNKGNIWVANNCNWTNSFDPSVQSIQRVDIKNNTIDPGKVAPPELAGCFQVYGITVDSQGRVIVGSYACRGLFRYTPDKDSWEWISTGAVGSPRGVVVDQNGYIYAAISNGAEGDMRHIVRVTPDFKSYSALDLGEGISHPVGAAIDRNGRFWTAGRNSDTCARVDIKNWVNNPKIDIFPTNGHDPYTYSDMTGFQHLMFTNPEGTWRQQFDGGADTVFWKIIEWSGIEEPGVTDISVRARAAAKKEALDKAGWTGWFDESPAHLQGVPNLRWLEVEVKLSSKDPEKTPILTGVKVMWAK